MKQAKNPTARRGFLIGAGAAAAVTAGAVVTQSQRQVNADVPEVLSPESTDSGRGYRLTDHIQRYYRTTRI
ncbi:MAG TPA: formate dehydrogenase [Burkholderiaceae bacterium]|nr:formate dehydrogenase [Burkholderiaceae bacterium]